MNSLIFLCPQSAPTRVALGNLPVQLYIVFWCLLIY